MSGWANVGNLAPPGYFDKDPWTVKERFELDAEGSRCPFREAALDEYEHPDGYACDHPDSNSKRCWGPGALCPVAKGKRVRVTMETAER